MLQKTIFTQIIFTTLSSLSLYGSQDGLPQTSEPVNKAKPLNIKHPPLSKGELLVICGAMCAGKSERLIEMVGRYRLSGRKVLVLKPAIDNRKLLQNDKDPLTIIPSRNGSWVDCVPTKSIEDMRQIAQQSDAEIIAIDEAHFFTPEQDKLVAFIQELIEAKKKIVIAGLELDFRGEPFGPMPKLLALADKVEKLPAICTVCGTDTFCLSQRLINGQPAHYDDPLIVVGASQYEPRCRKCHIIRKEKRNEQ